MKYGIREICDVVLKAKAAMKVGNKVFYKDEPVIYFDSLKTSTLEGASTTVYAQGGRGNARLVAWEGERTVTFTMEDALISPIGLMILTGAGLIEANGTDKLYIHTTEQTDQVDVNVSNNKITSIDIYLNQKPYIPNSGSISITDKRSIHDYIYVMLLKEGEIVSEPYIPSEVAEIALDANKRLYKVTIPATETAAVEGNAGIASDNYLRHNNFEGWSLASGENVVLVDYYVEKTSGAYQIDITPETFGGNFYLEASTLFRNQNGVDMPAEFIIPNCKVQSNFTFNMASSGDPSTFTFTMDAFPDYTRWNKKKKVLAALQVIDLGNDLIDLERLGTPHDVSYDANGTTATPYTTALSSIDAGRYGSDSRSHKNIIEEDGRQ